MAHPNNETGLVQLPDTAALPIRSPGLTPQAARFLEQGLAGTANTQRAYAADLRSYEAYCQANGYAAFPADLVTLTGYASHLATLPRKLATIRRHLAAIRKAHFLLNLRLAVDTLELEAVMRGITRELGKRQKQAPAFTVAELKAAIASLDLQNPGHVRDRALLLVGFAGAFRRSELVALDFKQLELTDQALVVHLEKSKANQEGNEEDKALFYAPNALFCPVRAFQDWARLMGEAPSGPVFVSMVRTSRGLPSRPGKRRLSDEHLNLIVKKHLGNKYTAHSFRSSFITVAKLNGQSNDFIKNQTKQKSDEMISRYSRLGDVIKFNAAQALGL